MLSLRLLICLIALSGTYSSALLAIPLTNIDQPAIHLHATASHAWRINTHNQHKLKDLNRLFAKHEQTFECSQIDLNEIDADPISVTAHKASQLGEYILVEDTSLDIEGADIGVNLRWKKNEVENHVGKRAVWRVLLAYRAGDSVYVYEGQVAGTIVESRGPKSYGFNSFFQPDGSFKTLSEEMTDTVDARALAVDAFMKNKYSAVVEAIYEWKGSWQHDK